MISISTGFYPQAVLLVMARVGGVMWVLQHFGASRLPSVFKACIAFVISIAMLPMVPQAWMDDASLLATMPVMLLALVQELGIGLCMGFVCELIISSTGVAGVLIGMGSSMMMAQSIDPTSGRQSGIPKQVLMSVFVLFLLLTDVHLEAIRLIGKSFSTLPMLASWDMESVARMLVGIGGMVFEWGLRLAMPIFCVALMLDACLGLMAKLAPNFDILFLSLPVRLFAGLAVLGLTVHSGASIFGLMREKMLLVFARLLCG